MIKVDGNAAQHGYLDTVYGKYTQSKKTTEANQNTHHSTKLPNLTDYIKEANEIRLRSKLDEWHDTYMSENGETPFSNLNELRWRDGD